MDRYIIRKATSIVIIATFLFTQCGFGWAAPIYKVGKAPQNLRAKSAGEPTAEGKEAEGAAAIGAALKLASLPIASLPTGEYGSALSGAVGSVKQFVAAPAAGAAVGNAGAMGLAPEFIKNNVVPVLNNWLSRRNFSEVATSPTLYSIGDLGATFNYTYEVVAVGGRSSLDGVEVKVDEEWERKGEDRKDWRCNVHSKLSISTHGFFSLPELIKNVAQELDRGVPLLRSPRAEDLTIELAQLWRRHTAPAAGEVTANMAGKPGNRVLRNILEQRRDELVEELNVSARISSAVSGYPGFLGDKRPVSTISLDIRDVDRELRKLDKQEDSAANMAGKPGKERVDDVHTALTTEQVEQALRDTNEYFEEVAGGDEAVKLDFVVGNEDEHHRLLGYNPQDRLAAFIDGGVSQEERRKIEAHLNVCPYCREEVEELRKFVEAHRQVVAPIVTDVPQVADRADEGREVTPSGQSLQDVTRGAPAAGTEAAGVGVAVSTDNMTRRKFLQTVLTGVVAFGTSRQSSAQYSMGDANDSELVSIVTFTDGNIHQHDLYSWVTYSPISPINASFNPPLLRSGVRGGDVRADFRELGYADQVSESYSSKFSIDAYRESSSLFWNNMLEVVGRLPSEQIDILQNFYKRLRQDFLLLMKSYLNKPDIIEHSRIHIGIMKELDVTIKKLSRYYSDEEAEKWRVATERLLETFFDWWGHSIIIPDGENAYRPVASGQMYWDMHFVPVDPERIPQDLREGIIEYTPRLPDYRNYWLSKKVPRPDTTAETPAFVVETCIDFLRPFEKTDRLLDLGCGELLPMLRLQTEGFIGAIEGYDYSKEMVRKAEWNIRHLIFDPQLRERIKVHEGDITDKKLQAIL